MRQGTIPPLSPAVTIPMPTGTATPALAARVNGEPILLSAFEQQLTVSRNELLSEGIDQATPEGEASPTELSQQVLDGMIDALLVRQAATEFGIEPSAADVESQVQADIAAAGGSMAFSEWLTATRQTELQYREAVRASITLQRVAGAVVGGVPSAGELVSVRRIELASPDAAMSVLARFRGGEDFSALAQDAAGVSGRSWHGEPVWVTRGMLEAGAESLVFSLGPGEVSNPVPLGDGHYVLYQVVEHKPYGPFSHDVKLALEALAFRQWLSGRRSEAVLEILAGP